MNRRAKRFTCLMVATVLGCGGGGQLKRVDAGASPDASSSHPDGSGVDLSERDTVNVPPDATSGDAPSTDGVADAAHIAVLASTLAVGGAIQLVGSGPDTCTNRVPASTDRWCGFAKSSALATFELWVIDVTKVAARVPVKCDGTDASCLRLADIYSDPTSGFRIDGFDGDTLTYSEAPTLSANGFIGTVSAWRPGWTMGRPLTSNAGIVCNGHHATQAAICIENAVSNASGDTTADLHAGLLDSQTGGTLPLVDTLLVTGAADAVGVQKWNAMLTPDGASVAWSTRATATGTENLKTQKIGDDASRAVVANDASQWIVTSDSAAWLWLSGYNYDQNGAPSGTLQSAAFPGGVSVHSVASAVGDFLEAGPKGVVYRSNVTTSQGSLVLVPDRDAPATTTVFDQGVSFVFEASKDGKRVTYTKNVQSLNSGTSTFPIFDLWMASVGATTPCAFSLTAAAFLAPQFLSGGDMAAWGLLNTSTGEVAGVYTTSADCVTRPFASDVFSWTPIGDEGYVFLDTLSPDPNVNEGTLRFGKVANGLLPTTGTAIQARAGLTFSTLLPSLSAAVYTVETGSATDGLYVATGLPFTTSP